MNVDEIWTDEMREILGIKLHERSSWKVIKKVRRHTYKYVTKKDIRTASYRRNYGETKIRIYEVKYVHSTKKNYSEDQNAEN